MGHFDLAEFADGDGIAKTDFWEELPCGVYSLSIGASGTGEDLTGEVLKHDWTDPKIMELITWERTSIQPKPEDLSAPRQKVYRRKEDSPLTSSFLMEPKLGQYHRDMLLMPSIRCLVDIVIVIRHVARV